jgi:hypothetical protein
VRGAGGQGKHRTPEVNFKRLANKNATKPEIGGYTLAIFPESLDPSRILAKT